MDTSPTPQEQNSQQEQNSNPPSALPEVFASGIYWRKSLWNGAKTVPSILTLRNGMVSLKSAKEIAFEAPIGSISAHMTPFKTLVIMANGKKFDINGAGAGISPQFNEEQKRELANQTAGASTNQATGGLGTNALGAGLGGAAGAGLSVLGTAVVFASFMKGVKELDKWKAIFKTAGVYKD
jgi:hypothetical protein